MVNVTSSIRVKGVKLSQNKILNEISHFNNNILPTSVCPLCKSLLKYTPEETGFPWWSLPVPDYRVIACW